MGWHAVAMSSDGSKQVAARMGANHLWTSLDSGVTWTEDASIGVAKNWQRLAMSSDGSKIVASSIQGIWRSIDSGASWTELTTMQAAGVAMSSDGSKIVACGSGLWVSTDSG